MKMKKQKEAVKRLYYDSVEKNSKKRIQIETKKKEKMEQLYKNLSFTPRISNYNFKGDSDRDYLKVEDRLYTDYKKMKESQNLKRLMKNIRERSENENGRYRTLNTVGNTVSTGSRKSSPTKILVNSQEKKSSKSLNFNTHNNKLNNQSQGRNSNQNNPVKMTNSNNNLIQVTQRNSLDQFANLTNLTDTPAFIIAKDNRNSIGNNVNTIFLQQHQKRNSNDRNENHTFNDGGENFNNYPNSIHNSRNNINKNFGNDFDKFSNFKTKYKYFFKKMPYFLTGICFIVLLAYIYFS